MADETSDDAAVQAFEDVRAEVTLLRRAIERLSAERTEVPDAVDYSETLGVMSNNVSVIAHRVDILAKSAALSLTPETMSGQINAAASIARREDQRMLTESRTALDQTTRVLSGMIMSARQGDAQNWWLVWTGLGGTILGMLLWAACAGPIAHLAPDSWQWPERMAARTLRMPMLDAGQHLMASASPAEFAMFVEDGKIMTANRKTVDGCTRAAAKARDTVRCTIQIAPDDRRAASNDRHR